jgi:beta-barrel assembly-enhancing protease
MKQVTFSLALLLVAAPAFAQFGRLNDVIDKTKKVKRLADITISDVEERAIGQQVSDRIINEFGVYQDPALARYVSLLGSLLAQASERPALDWHFIVLDTAGVNAFAAPGGFVHVTRGLLGMLENEAELAGVLGHEIIHVTEKHTVNSIQKNDYIRFGADEVSTSGGLTQALISRFAERAYYAVLNNEFDRDDEKESDEDGVALANKVGYAPDGLSHVLRRLAERNKDRKEPNGLFASHPTIADRLANIAKAIRDGRLTATATVQARYAEHVKFEATPIDELTVVDPGVRGLTGGDGDGDAAKKEDEKKDEKKSRGGLGGALSKMRVTGGSQAQNTQTVASAGARGGWPDRDAVGGSNKRKVPVQISSQDLAEFKKGIA